MNSAEGLGLFLVVTAAVGGAALVIGILGFAINRMATGQEGGGR